MGLFSLLGVGLYREHQASTMSEVVKLSDAQKKAAEESFNSFDKKGDSQIKVGDLESALKKIGHNVTGEWMEKMDEFITLVQQKMQADADDRELRDCFRVLDKEKKGEVNTNELRWILKSLGDDLTEDDIDDMIADVDTDGSGWV